MTSNQNDEVTRVNYTFNLALLPISPEELEFHRGDVRPGCYVARIIRLVDELQERIVIAEEKEDLERLHADDLAKRLSKLAEDFARYARHRETCTFETSVYLDCDCGFAEVSE